MKKFLAIVAMFAVIVSGGVAQAMRSETMDITKKIFEITDGFYKPMFSRNLDMAKSEYTICLNAHSTLYDYLSAYKPQADKNGYVINYLDNSDRDVIYHATIIITYRAQALYDYILALEAYKNGDQAGQNSMIDACSRDLQYANEYRQNFINIYGY